MQKLYEKEVIDDITGEKTIMLGKYIRTQFNDSSVYVVAYTNEEGNVCETFRDIMSDYLHVPFDFNKSYLDICIKSVYKVLRGCYSITSKTIGDVIDEIYYSL